MNTFNTNMDVLGTKHNREQLDYVKVRKNIVPIQVIGRVYGKDKDTIQKNLSFILWKKNIR